MTRVRCSRLDRFMICADSELPCGSPNNPDSAEAQSGRRVHFEIANAIDGETYTDPLPDEEARLVHYAVGFYLDVLRSAFPHGVCEVAVQSPHLTGHSDYMDYAVGFADWKSGWSQDEHPWQLHGYADCMRHMHGMPECGYIVAVEVWLRHRSHRVHHLTADNLDAFRARLVQQISLIGSQAQPGSHCGFCPRNLECEQYLQATRAAGCAIAHVADATRTITRGELAELYDRSLMLERGLKRYREMVRCELDKGPMDLGDGRELYHGEYHTSSIDPLVLIDHLRREYYSEDEINACLKVVNKDLDTVVKSQVIKGKGSAAARAMRASLQERGAVTVNATKRRMIRRKEDT